jgi:hypothetical protein
MQKIWWNLWNSTTSSTWTESCNVYMYMYIVIGWAVNFLFGCFLFEPFYYNIVYISCRLIQYAV